MAMSIKNRSTRLAPDVNRVLFVRNLPFKISAEELYDLFGRYGAVYQIRLGTAADTRGTAFVVYEDIHDAKNACDHLSGFNIMGRYLIVLYFQRDKPTRKGLEKRTRATLQGKDKLLDDIRKEGGIMDDAS